MLGDEFMSIVLERINAMSREDLSEWREARNMDDGVAIHTLTFDDYRIGTETCQATVVASVQDACFSAANQASPEAIEEIVAGMDRIDRRLTRMALLYASKELLPYFTQNDQPLVLQLIEHGIESAASGEKTRGRSSLLRRLRSLDNDVAIRAVALSAIDDLSSGSERRVRQRQLLRIAGNIGMYCGILLAGSGRTDGSTMSTLAAGRAKIARIIGECVPKIFDKIECLSKR